MTLSQKEQLKRRIMALRQWKKVPEKVRKAHASMMAKERWAKKSPEERSAFGKRMVEIRWKKRLEREMEAEIKAAHEKGSEAGMDAKQDRE